MQWYPRAQGEGGDSREVEEDLMIVFRDLAVDVVLLAGLHDDERHVDPLIVGYLSTTTLSTTTVAALSSHAAVRHTCHPSMCRTC